MAAYSFSRRLDNSTGSREWKRFKRGRHDSNGARMVWVCIVDHRHDRTVGHDIEYQSVGRDIWLSKKF